MKQDLNQMRGNSPKQVQRDLFSLAGCYDLLCALSVKVQYNVITGEVDVLGELPYLRNVQQDKRLDALATIIYSDYRGLFMGCTQETIWKYLEIIAYDAPYNPVMNEILLQEWDGIDRLAEVYHILGLDDGDDLSRTLVRKWFHQGISLLDNDEKEPFGADGMLVLCGVQGIGKTSLFRKFAIREEWCKEGGSIKPNDKDTSRRVMTKWIAELGELESSLSGDIAELKAFITASRDSYRLTYARCDTIKVRRTNLCATCNNTDFLVDQTGNRRFWTVPVGKIDLEAFHKLDALQLWAQIYHLYGHDKQGFRLTPDERARLEERNGAHTVKLPAEDEILDILSEAQEHPEWWQDTTITNFMGCYPALNKSGITAAKVGKVLKKLNIEQKRKRLNGERDASRVYHLPIKSHYGFMGG